VDEVTSSTVSARGLVLVINDSDGVSMMHAPATTFRTPGLRPSSTMIVEVGNAAVVEKQVGERQDGGVMTRVESRLEGSDCDCTRGRRGARDPVRKYSSIASDSCDCLSLGRPLRLLTKEADEGYGTAPDPTALK
jgi:hypothetical protein